MPNTFETPGVLLNELLMHFENELAMATLINKDFGNEFGAIGDTAKIRRAVRLELLEGNSNFVLTNADYQDIIEGIKEITLDQELKIKPFQIPVLERTLDVTEDRVQMFIRNAITPMAERVETAVGSLYKKVWNTHNKPGTPITNRNQIGLARSKMTQLGVPGQWHCAHDPDTADGLADLIIGLYDDQNVTPALRDCTIGKIAKVMNYESVHIPHHTVGDHGGTPLVNGAAQNVNYVAVKDTNEQTLVTDGWTASEGGLLKEGDVFTIAGVNSVNPVTKQSTGKLQEFVVKADVGSDGGGNATVTISPAIVIDGAFQNVSAAPGDNAVITVTGDAGVTYRQSLMFNRDFGTIVSRPLQIENSGSFTTVQKSGNRMSLSLTRWSDPMTLAQHTRIDGLYKVDDTDPARAIRIWGAEV